jgi:7,8-dihydropterin-6-yl-methyl-4-(beta-D-ribofuranosyl)aminobenzene 5'-phosphate synthase
MVELNPVDTVEITLLVNNFVDILLAGAEGVRRFPLAYDFFGHQKLVAEHGSPALVTDESGRAAQLDPLRRRHDPLGA